MAIQSTHLHRAWSSCPKVTEIRQETREISVLKFFMLKKYKLTSEGAKQKQEQSSGFSTHRG